MDTSGTRGPDLNPKFWNAQNQSKAYSKNLNLGRQKKSGTGLIQITKYD